jgi:hypothetical protein
MSRRKGFFAHAKTEAELAFREWLDQRADRVHVIKHETIRLSPAPNAARPTADYKLVVEYKLVRRSR